MSPTDAITTDRGTSTVVVVVVVVVVFVDVQAASATIATRVIARRFIY
jgi:hypothetical protein